MRTLKTFLMVFAVSTAFTITGCKKDSDESKDPCENVTCKNGGECANGECNCPDGYTGSDCSQQATPDQIRIHEIVLDEFPPLNDGSDWDGTFCGGGNPDVYISLEDSDGEIYVSSNYSDCVPGYSITFNSGLPVSISNPNDLVTLRLYDHDTGGCAPSDYMGGLQGTIYDSENGFPSTIRFYNPGAHIDATFHVEYVF